MEDVSNPKSKPQNPKQFQMIKSKSANGALGCLGFWVWMMKYHHLREFATQITSTLKKPIGGFSERGSLIY